MSIYSMKEIMAHNFDRIINRTKTNSVKHDTAVQHDKPLGILPLWVADMDFPAPTAVIRALEEKVRHGIFGYSQSLGNDIRPVLQWMERYFNWQAQAGWLVQTPGVVFAIATAIRAFTGPGQSIMVQQPVYYPFSSLIVNNRRNLVVNPLSLRNGSYTIDFDDFEAQIKRHDVKIFILCNPHNPVGRVWTAEELTRLGDVCRQQGVLVISDEVHQDFIWPGHLHRVFAGIKSEFNDITITCTAPSKTFNLAGLQLSNIFIANERLRVAFTDEMQRAG